MARWHANLWLVAAGLVYPAVLFARLLVCFPPPWWMLDRGPTVFFVFVLPTLAGATLIVARLRGVGVSWLAIPIFVLWLGLVAWWFVNLLADGAASV